jgi:hypothetical protein
MLMLVLVLVASIGVERAHGGASCRVFSVWRYPWPQHCPRPRVTRVGARVEAVEIPLPSLEGVGARVEAVEIPLPSLEGIEWGNASTDERLTGMSLLRAKLEGGNR